jgi:hypothetical protein
MMDLSGQLSLSLLPRRVSLLGSWGRRSEPSTAVKAGNLRYWLLARDLYQTSNATWAKLKPQCTDILNRKFN